MMVELVKPDSDEEFSNEEDRIRVSLLGSIFQGLELINGPDFPNTCR